MSQPRIQVTILAFASLLALTPPAVSDWILQWDEVERLARSGEPEATGQLREIGHAPGTTDWLKGRVLVGLARRDAENIRDEILETIASSNAVLRAAACEALGIIGAKSDTKTLARLVKQDPDEGARYAAALALSRHGGPDAWEGVKDLSLRPTETFVEQRAELLGNTTGEAGTNMLAHMLLHTNAPAIRMRTARALHRVRNPAVVALLFRSAADRDAKVRAIAESSLRAFDADTLADTLAGVFHSDEEARYMLAATLLLRRPSTTGGDALAELVARKSGELKPALLSRAMDALLAIDPARYRDTIGQYVEDKDPSMRMRALTALTASQEDEDIYAILRKPLFDPESRVFDHALKLLEKRTEIPPQDGLVTYLEPYVSDTNTTRTARFLAIMKKRLLPEEAARALDLLRPHLEGANASLRRSAIDVFATSTDDEVISQAMSAQGYVTTWVVTGPFDNDKRNTGFSVTYGPEDNQDLGAVYQGTERSVTLVNAELTPSDDVVTGVVNRVTWQRMPIAAGDGTVRLNRLLMRRADYFTGYGMAEIHSPVEQEVEFQARGDDAIKMWLNGSPVLTLAEPPIPDDKKPTREEWEVIMRKWTDNPRDGTVKVTLKQGRNRILVKCSSYTHAWYFSLRIAASDGARADFEEIELMKLEEE